MSAESPDSGNLPYEHMGDGPGANTARFRFKSDLDIADVNELRRIMLGELGGIAIRAFGIKVNVGGKGEETILHRYCAIDNVREDTATLIRNLRHVVVENARYKPGTAYGEEYVFDASDFDEDETELEVDCGKLVEKNPAVRFVNENQPVMTLVRETCDQDIELTLRLFFDDKPGFQSFEENEYPSDSFDVIPIDAQHSPVIRCAFHKDEASRCVLAEIETNGAMTPEDALKNAFLQSSNFSLLMM